MQTLPPRFARLERRKKMNWQHQQAIISRHIIPKNLCWKRSPELYMSTPIIWHGYSRRSQDIRYFGIIIMFGAKRQQIC